jgi:alpha-tubulin suppressor-like RCC1 family protein
MVLLLVSVSAGCLAERGNPWRSGLFACSSDAKCTVGYVCIGGRCYLPTDPVCGNGRVDEELDEQCDDGEANGQYGRCRQDCTGPGEHCGDGHVQTHAGEQCDGGAELEARCVYGVRSCTVCDDRCQRRSGTAFYCGDGVVQQPWEACDNEAYCTSACRIRAKLASGAEHSCALWGDGAIACWGRGGDGQLGNGQTPAVQPVPVEVGPLRAPAVDLAAGGRHSCALWLDGAVSCWGANDHGQLGDGAGFTHRSQPVVVSRLKRAAEAISAGRSHTCALLEDGSVQCWGSDRHGQLGTGGWEGLDRAEPVGVASLDGAAESICAGGHHNCVLLAGGAVRCWGWDGRGQLGDSALRADRAAPAAAVGLETAAVALACGFRHTCAVLANGTLACWGDDLAGQLGDDENLRSQPTPVAVAALDGAVVAVAAGYAHTCAVLKGGVVRCWGGNDSGQLGAGLLADWSAVPLPVAGLGGVALQLAAGRSHTCALLAHGTVRCWGRGGEGQLGEGGEGVERAGPVSVVGTPADVGRLSDGTQWPTYFAPGP